ncbi:MAG: TIGR02530 family flagellar biosynthesis protein [Planctomycetota bacterium]
MLEQARAKAAPEGEVNFSRHASERLRDRGIELSDNDVTKISEGLDRAKAKGARDSLMLYGNLGLIVNVPSRTIVTAVDENSMTEKVFTNIDSTVIVPR